MIRANERRGLCACDRRVGYAGARRTLIAPDRGGGAAIIEIVIGAATVRVGAGTDVATLTKVLRAVKAAT